MSEQELNGLPPGAIAIVGMACRLPGARNVDEYWRNLCAGTESVVPLSDEVLTEAGVTPEQFNAPNYVKAAAILEDMEMFDAGFFGFSPKEASIMDPQHRHFLECCWEALEHAGYDPFTYEGSIGTFAGCGMQAYFAQNLLPNRKLIESTGFFLVRHTGNDKDFLSTRVAYQLNLRGPSLSVQTACSTSLVAVHMAAQSLLSGECDMTLAGGVTIELPHRRGYFYEDGEILSRDGHCRAFDAASTGTLFGSGVGVVVMRRLEDALASGDTIHGVLLGSAINNDGAGKVSYLAPSVEGQSAAVAEALAVAGVDADSITFVETHGTGTQIGDPIEITALTRAFRETTKNNGFCALGAVKTNIGHLDTAAGIAGLIKAVLSAKHGKIPPTLHYQNPNPQINFASTPFFVNATLRDWVLPAGVSRRRAGVNSLGVGGTNAHVIVEEPPDLPATTPAQAGQLLIWSARSVTALDQMTRRFCEHLKAHAELNLADVAHTLQSGRHGFNHRRVLAVRDREDAIAVLESGDRKRIFTAQCKEQGPPLAFMFPGGGAQYPRMGQELYETEELYRKWIDQGLEILNRRWQIDLRPLMFPAVGGEAAAAVELERPLKSILSIFLTEYALARLWMSWNVQPQVMTGHSLGEYTAACLAGVMSLEDTLTIVVARGRIFERLPEGAMLSVAMSEKETLPHLDQCHSFAAINAPGLCVVSGTVEEIDALQEKLLGKEIDCQKLKISVAAHSGMLDPFLEEFRNAFADVKFGQPTIPFISNLTGELAQAAQVMTPDYWVRHLRHTVRFSDGLQTLTAEHPRCVLLEVGPGNTLSALARLHPVEQVEPVAIPSMRHPKEVGSDRQVYLSAFGRLWTAGCKVDWKFLRGAQLRRRIPLPTYPFEHQKYWIDARPLRETTESTDDLSMVRRAAVDQWLVQPLWEEKATTDAVSSIGADVFVVLGCDNHDTTDLATSLAHSLKQHATASGQPVRVLTAVVGSTFAETSESRLVFDPASATGLNRLAEHVFALTEKGVCFVRLPAAEATDSSDNPLNHLTDRSAVAFYQLVGLAQAVSEAGSTKPWWLCLVTRGAFSVAGESSIDPVASLGVGACRVIPREFSKAQCKVIDLPGGSSALARPRVLRQLAEEIVTGESDREVALRSGGRWVMKISPVRTKVAQSGPALLRTGGVYLITGGLGGLGYELARHLAEKYNAKLILVSRRAILPDQSDDMARRLAGLEALTEVHVVSADVAKIDPMQAAVRSAEARFGEINGVFHCAGTLDDELLVTKTPEAMERVLEAKVAGTLVLDSLFADRNLDFMVLYSSVSAWLGLPGQVDYAAANAFLDAMAWRGAQLRDYPVLSIGWGAWKEVGMAARLVGSETETRSAKRALSHPLISSRGTGTDGTWEYTSTLEPAGNWILDGHRTKSGVALLPGTGYLELVRAALADATGSRSVTIEDLVFISPLVVEGPTEMRLEFSPGSGEVVVSSRVVENGAVGKWVEHVRGRGGPCQDGPRPRMDLERIRAGCSRFERSFQVGDPATRQDQMLKFGARWSTLRKAWFGANEAMGELRLGDQFVSDLAAVPLHPAMLDIATAFALPLISGYDDGNAFYVPLAYRKVDFHRPLEPLTYSLIRCRDTANSDTVVFDVTLLSAAGEVLVEISEFTMKRLPGTKLEVAQERSVGSGASDASQPIVAAADMTLERAVASGISTSDGFQALDLILREGAVPQTIVCPFDVVLWSQLLAKSHGRPDTGTEGVTGTGDGTVSQPRPSVSTPLVLPANEIEEKLAAIWKESLGLAEVGVDDNFFELGGHSLALVQVIVRCRKALQINIPVGDRDLLNNPTIKAIARFADRDPGAQLATKPSGIKKLSRDQYRVRA